MNLLEMIKSEIGSDVVSSLSQKAGVSEDQVQTGLSAGIPAVLAGILKNGAGGDTGILGSILSGVTGFGNSASPDDLLHGDQDSLLEKGKSMLGGLFGGDANSVTDAVSSSTGLSGEKSAGLLAMIVPVITGYISKLMTTHGWGFSDLIGKIFDSKSDIAAALPSSLSGVLGIAGLNIPKPNINIPLSDVHTPPVEIHVPPVNVKTPKVEEVRRPHYDKVEPTSSGSSVLKWLIPVVLVLFGLWWLMGKPGCNHTDMTNASSSLSANIDSAGAGIDSATDAMGAGASNVAAATMGKLNEAGDYIRDLGAKISTKLPDGVELNVAENSVENRLISFIENERQLVDKTTWFTFDRLFFETGKSTLKAESQEQLNNIAAILKAYPNVHLKLGGYTDNTGDAAVNKNISNERANTAMQALVKLGVDAKRLSAEGYGQEHPVASNDTPEGKAQNRRIDIRVTEK